MHRPTELPVVTIDTGDVRGTWREASVTAGESAMFLGIPFAQAPVGELRFAAPARVEPWEGVRDALEHGPTPQRGDTGITLIPEPSVPGEATLNVNVFTPAPGATASPLPVVVYFHGGGFVSGSPASPWYDGRSFARDGVVVVTASYRLGFDGFGHIDGAPSNRGIRDWLAALEWVQRNIAAFGGDPGRVTIAGQSAGGGAVLTLLGMPAAQHLFHAAWSLSGALADVSAERARTFSAKLANLAGVAPTRADFATVPEATLRDLQDKATAHAGGSPLDAARAILAEGRAWGPTIDGDLMTRPTVDALRAGIGADKPLVIGATDDEFTMTTDRVTNVMRLVPAPVALRVLGVEPAVRRAYLAANAPQRRKGSAAVVGRYVTDAVFRSTVVRVADARAARAKEHAEGAASAPTWTYRFAWPSPTRRWALHCLDVPFWFDVLDAPGVTALTGDTPPRRLASAVHGAAVAFARDHDPGWAPWEASATRVFGGDPSLPDLERDGYANVRALL